MPCRRGAAAGGAALRPLRYRPFGGGFLFLVPGLDFGANAENFLTKN